MNPYEQLAFVFDETKRNHTALGRKLGQEITLEQAQAISDTECACEECGAQLFPDQGSLCSNCFNLRQGI
jgi:hypothetical protein